MKPPSPSDLSIREVSTLFSLTDEEADELLTTELLHKAWEFCTNDQAQQDAPKEFHESLRSIVADLAADGVADIYTPRSITKDLTELQSQLVDIRAKIRPPIRKEPGDLSKPLPPGSQSLINRIPRAIKEDYLNASINFEQHIKRVGRDSKHRAEKGGRPKTVGLANATISLLNFWMCWADQETVPMSADFVKETNRQGDLVHPAWAFVDLLLRVVRPKHKPSQIRSAIKKAVKQLADATD